MNIIKYQRKKRSWEDPKLYIAISKSYRLSADSKLNFAMQQLKAETAKRKYNVLFVRKRENIFNLQDAK